MLASNISESFRLPTATIRLVAKTYRTVKEPKLFAIAIPDRSVRRSNTDRLSRDAYSGVMATMQSLEIRTMIAVSSVTSDRATVR